MSEAIVEKSRVFNDNDILRHQIDILCFLPDKSDKEQVETVLARLELKDNSIRRGTIKEATKYLSKNPSPRLLVVDIGISETPLASILALAEVCEPQTRVVAIGTADTVDLYRDLIQAGVSD